MKRISKWDNVKCILIFLVVLGHVIEPQADTNLGLRSVWFFIYTFHMPAFLFVSGLFSKRTINENRFSKAVTYFVLYLFIKILMFAVQAVLYHKYTFSLFVEDGVAWYALVLCFCVLIGMAVKKFRPYYVLTVAIILACVAGYDTHLGDTLAISRTIVYFPFFYVGYLLDTKKGMEFLNDIRFRIAGAVIVAGSFVFTLLNINRIYWMRPLITGRNPFSELTFHQNLGALFRLIYYPAVMIMILSVLAVIPICKCFLTDFGKRSVQIYSLHRAVLYVITFIPACNFFLTKSMTSAPIIPALIVSAVIFAVCGLRFWEGAFDRLLDPEKKFI